MSDLISRSEVLELLYKIFDKYQISTDKNSSRGESFGGDVFKEIKNIPTAYNIDKVVEELELHSFELGTDTLPVHYVRLNESIEIVNQGGVTDDTDNVCDWIKYDYKTICPKNHDANNPYWRIPDNMDKLKYCPYCGKKIKVVK